MDHSEYEVKEDSYNIQDECDSDYDDYDTDDNGKADWRDVDTDNDENVSSDERDKYLDDWDSELSDASY